MAKYLYGAAAQGIQSFIFQTNKLSEIVGASELVEEICTSKFAEMVYGSGEGARKALKNDKGRAILYAAGNIKYIFDDKEKCASVVREFPKRISTFAPGVTLSQAVVEFEDAGDPQKFKKAVNELERRLRIQRNKQMRSNTLGLMGIERSRQTGLPVSHIVGNDHFDLARYAKLYDSNDERQRTTQTLCKKAFGQFYGEAEICYDIENMTGTNDWIAVIHADGNGLGQVVQKIGENKDAFREFSNNLDAATTESAVAAFKAVSEKYKWGKRVPIRPIVLGGDDLTVVCRADLAVDYVLEFIRHFEASTKEKLGDVLSKKKVFEKGSVTDRLTACAGIAFVKSSYPFYYAYELAEALCSRAKKDAKNKTDIKAGKELPQSCIMFHKVQDTFAEEYEEIVKRELTPSDGKSFEYGPYYLNEKEDRWTVETLLEKVKSLGSGGSDAEKEANAAKTGLRQWMTLLHRDTERAEQRRKRMIEISGLKEYLEEVTEWKKRDKRDVCPVYDIMALHTIMTQNTNNEDDGK